jgi:Family of unknown function (DUF5832)
MDPSSPSIEATSEGVQRTTPEGASEGVQRTTPEGAEGVQRTTFDTSKKVEITPLEPPLSRAEAQKAIPHTIRDFPLIVRTQVDPPVEGQAWAVLSFKMLDTPMKQGDVVMYGFTKLRGVDATKDLAKMRAARLVQDVDSVHINYIVKVGGWYPLLRDPNSAVQEKIHTEVTDLRAPGSLNVSIPKLAERLDKTLYDKHVEGIKKEAQDLEEKMKMLHQDSNEDPSSLDYYTSKRSKWGANWKMEQELLIRLNSIQANKERVRSILKYLDDRYPQHRENDAWIKNWNERGKKSGVPELRVSEAERAAYAVEPETAIEPDDTPLPLEVDPELLPLEAARWDHA